MLAEASCMNAKRVCFATKPLPPLLPQKLSYHVSSNLCSRASSRALIFDLGSILLSRIFECLGLHHRFGDNISFNLTLSPYATERVVNLPASFIA